MSPELGGVLGSSRLAFVRFLERETGPERYGIRQIVKSKARTGTLDPDQAIPHQASSSFYVPYLHQPRFWSRVDS